LFIAVVGGLGSDFVRLGEQCRPEAWANQGTASMPEGLLGGAALPPMYQVYMTLKARTRT